MVGSLFKKIAISTLGTIIIGSCLLFLPIIAVVGVVVGNDQANYQTHEVPEYDGENLISGVVVNNYKYAAKYKMVLNKYLKSKGYVSLERLVFYLQQTNNILDVSTLSNEIWSNAYLKNVNEDIKQMRPIGQICENMPTRYIQGNGALAPIYLCNKDKLDTTYKDLSFVFPLKSNFTVTSFVHEQRYVYGKLNTHNGWDLAVPIGTEFYSICDGKVSKVVNTQANDLPHDLSGNDVGNYVTVKCNNNTTAIYYHIKYQSSPYGVGDVVQKGAFLGKTSTTGYSTGPHLHLGLKDSKGNLLEPMDYINLRN